MATDATGTPTSPDSIARILPSDAPAVTTLTSGVNAIADTLQTALTNNYLRKTSGNIVNADINAAAAIAYSKLNLAASITSNDIVNGTITGTDIASDIALAGNPTTTTQAADNNTTRIATTAYVVGQVSATTPNTTGTATAAIGTSLKYARADHTHKLTTNIYDTTGTASLLNPQAVFSGWWEGDYQGQVTGLGDGLTYYLAQDGLNIFTSGASGFPSGNAVLFCVDWDGLVALGGTVQWRWRVGFTQTGVMGGASRSFTVQYQPYVFGTVSGGSLTGVASGSNWADSTGNKTFDSGFLTAPTGDGSQVGYAATFISTRSGGTTAARSRMRLDVQVRVV